MSDNFEVSEDHVIAERIRKFKVDDFVANGRKVVVSDLDEVLVNITIPWIVAIRESGKAPQIPADLSIRDIINRREYYISKEYDVDVEIVNSFYSGDFYRRLKPTTIGAAFAEMLKQGSIDLCIVSHGMEPTNKSKAEWVKRWFPKATLIIADMDQKKSEVINGSKFSDYSMFLDDRPEVMLDVLENTNSLGKELMMPQYGYNNNFAALVKDRIVNRGVTFSYFENVL